MTINNENISKAIYAVIWAYNCQKEYFGVKRIHIEDEAPIEIKAQIAGMSPFAMRVLGVEVTLMGMAVNEEQMESYGYGDLGNFITIFYNDLLKASKDDWDLLIRAYKCVKHELRHIQQFQFLREHGVNPTEALMKENQAGYGNGPLEKDAWSVQEGDDTPIEEAMACFLQ